MPAPRTPRKTNWKDIGDLRRPNADSETRRRAHGVRVAANRVLHGEPAAPTDALQAVEDTRLVLVALSR